MFEITRQIGIDAGHRVPDHGSKCRHTHGHRYLIEVTCEAQELHAEGEQKDMVLDFGFLKEEMMDTIDSYCDHGFISSIHDLLSLGMFFGERRVPEEYLRIIQDRIDLVGYWSTLECQAPVVLSDQKLYVVPFSPTAERLAQHWYKRLVSRVEARSNGIARIKKVKVWETPNCYAVYPSS